MKKLALVFGLMIVAQNGFAERETGGVPAAPRAVVIQGHLVNGNFDLAGRQKALELAGRYLAADTVYAFKQHGLKQGSNRTYLCVEFLDYNHFLQATQAFKDALSEHVSIEVVSNGTCNLSFP